MAVTYKGDVNLGLSIDDSGQTLKRVLVFFCENGEDITELRHHKDFPSIGDSHPSETGLKASAITVSPSCDGGKNKYEVEIEYSNALAVTSETDSSMFNQPFNLSLSTIEKVVPFEFSYDRVSADNQPLCPVVTSAGTAISASTVKTSLLLKFSYYLRIFKAAWILDVADTVNRNPIKVCGLDIPPECGLIKTISAESVSGANGESFFQVDVSMEISTDGFLRTFPNRSVYYRGPNGNPTRIYMAVNAAGNPIYGSDRDLAGKADSSSTPVPVDEPLWLSTSGAILPSQNVAPGEENFLYFKEKRPHSWSQLSLPQTGTW